jgi:transposase InsO family protein
MFLSCGWRIVVSPIIPLDFPSCYDSVDARSGRSFHPLHRDPGPLARTWRRPLHRCRVASPQAPTPDPESLPAPIAESIRVGPHPRRSDGALGAAYSSAPVRHRTQALNPARSSPSLEPAKVPHAVLTKSPSKVRPERTECRTHPCGRGHEAASSPLGLSPNRPADRLGIPHSNRQRRGSKDSRPSPLAGTGLRCESATLRTHWVLVIMDQYTRPIIGFGVHAGTVDGVALCRMFNRALRGQLWMPNYLSSDHDPLYKFHQWQANLRILEVTEIKSVPCVPLSHPFVERLIGTIRREYLDHTLFWTTADLENKLLEFRTYFNHHRTHTSRDGQTPDTPASRPVANLRSFRWQPHCRGLFQTPVAA